MSARRVVQVALLAVVGVSLAIAFWPSAPATPGGTEARTAVGSGAGADAAPGSSGAAPAPVEGPVLHAYYFHGDRRCETCQAIEQQCTAAIESGFPVEIAEGRLVFETVNTDRRENRHYTVTYGLTHSTLVLAEIESGEPIRHVALDRVWELVWDEEEFRRYVQDAVAGWLEPAASR